MNLSNINKFDDIEGNQKISTGILSYQYILALMNLYAESPISISREEINLLLCIDWANYKNNTIYLNIDCHDYLAPNFVNNDDRYEKLKVVIKEDL
ncbi:MAG: hypothetical protein GY830_05645 [Bacteroidetes bacterium]|nr:hypothetical protein [Bacteroidota bacterium]